MDPVMRPQGDVVARGVVFELLGNDYDVRPDAPVVPVRTELSYDPSDPCAVQAAFDCGGGELAVWLLARELLSGGLIAPTGVGDVQVRPDPQRDGRVLLRLSAPSGVAVFSAPAEEIGEFLGETYRRVPAGAEYATAALDVDMELLALLGDGPASGGVR